MSKSVFETLSSINVNDKVEKNNNLSYLPWAWAWGETKKHYPSATYTVMRDPQTDKPYFTDTDLGIMVMTSVTIDTQTLEMWLPVLDYRNKAISIDKATMFDVNTSLMRCLTKNLAMFGLGHYIYAGEDIPQEDNSTEPSTFKKEIKQAASTLRENIMDKAVSYIQSQSNKEKAYSSIITKYGESLTDKQKSALQKFVR